MEVVEFLDPETGEEDLFFVLEQTCIGGVTYLLVTDNADSEEANAYILKEMQTVDDSVMYAVVEDDNELNAIAKVFQELLDDIDLA